MVDHATHVRRRSRKAVAMDSRALVVTGVGKITHDERCLAPFRTRVKLLTSSRCQCRGSRRAALLPRSPLVAGQQSRLAVSALGPQALRRRTCQPSCATSRESRRHLPPGSQVVHLAHTRLRFLMIISNAFGNRSHVFKSRSYSVFWVQSPYCLCV